MALTSTITKEDFVPDEPFLLLFVGRSLGDDLSLVYPADVYAAARGWWAMNPGSQEDAPGYLVLARGTGCWARTA